MNDATTHIYSLSELNSGIRSAIEMQLSDEYWVCAEISEFHPNRNGHCYLELIEKDLKGRTLARQRAVIWANIYKLLSPYFEQETGQILAAGIKILVLVSVNFHEIYGMSLVIHDINPTYTIGEAARHRAEILTRLETEGIINDNKELNIPLLPQRIAIISSQTAAGYGDFMSQLHNNSYSYQFYTTLFTATMQGGNTASSVIEALNHIHEHIECYDVVVIIRGGGSTSELASFDDYELACNIAQFPLPVVVGIGHERDETVLDYIAAVRVKTPTAAAEWLIEQARLAENMALTLRKQVVDIVSNRLLQENTRLQQFTSNIPYAITQRLHNEERRQLGINNTITHSIQEKVSREYNRLSLFSLILPERTHNLLSHEQQHIDNLARTIKLLSPDATLARGYSLVLHNNKVVKSVDELPADNKVDIHLADGTAQAHISNIKKTPDNEKTSI